ncbi:hypothetical protein [Lishizhenia tianjinensis]|uniref:hypothetical protein n=1 Tax=Lishizhenia tianjinensis TaxID=477690 RepID=UPI0011135576|nr:hypothetical protein [Lishizhenia tianjinensis]
MKNVSLLLVFFGLWSISSCSKDYTCSCTYNYANGSPTDTTEHTVSDITESYARERCQEDNYNSTEVSVYCDLLE